jgi:hypothetical protein
VCSSDLIRFPDRAVVNELLSFNRAYRAYVETCQPSNEAQSARLHAAKTEVDHLHQVWSLVHDARSDYYYVALRRQALKKLRELIGDDAYYAGELPPHVPLWRFHEMP